MTTNPPVNPAGENRSALPPIPRDPRAKREVWVGVFVVLGVVAILIALFMLTDPAYFRGRYMISTAVDDAGGIRRGDPVELRGVNIGRVRGFDIGPGGVVVRLEIEGKYKIPSDSQVRIASGSLLGGMTAEIVPGTSTHPAPPGSVLPGKTGQNTLGEVGRIATQSEEVLDRVKSLLSEQTVQGVEASSTELAQLLRQLSDLVEREHEQVATLTDKLSQSAAHVEDLTSKPELDRSVHRLDAITASLSGATASLARVSSSLEEVARRIQLGKGTLGRLSSDDTLYVNANEAVANVNQSAAEIRRLVEDIRKNPRRYLHISFF